MFSRRIERVPWIFFLDATTSHIEKFSFYSYDFTSSEPAKKKYMYETLSEESQKAANKKK